MSSAPEEFAHSVPRPPVRQRPPARSKPPALPKADPSVPATASTPSGPSGIERFVESFLQERNIKWMLGIGVFILLGSSLSFVRSHWDNMHETFRYLVVLGYTGLIHLCGQAAYHKLNLRKTGTALMAVTLLLIPLVFFSLHWVAGSTTGQHAGLALVLCVATVFSALAARRIFGHFLHGDQPAVLVSYLSLSLLGAVAPLLPQSMGALWALLAWALFAFGSVKANREVFWMAEEHKLPRIFGFFPIVLFGLQFLAIFSQYFADSLPTNDWYGLGCVLTAIPVMLTADALAKVFQQRTGDLVRPLPWSISGPIVVGLILSVAGLGIAATGIVHPSKPFALIPTALVFAAMMGVTAHRTGKRGFTWAMLLGAIMAYQFTPLLFRELLMSVRDAAASTLNESPRKMVPYYGLTYMPFLLTCSLVARWRHRRHQLASCDVFSQPLRHFTLGASVLLLGISFLNPGANFLVAAVMVPFMLWQAVAYGRREATGFGLIAFVTAAVRLVPFLEQVTEVRLPNDASIIVLGLAAVLLQMIGPKLDAFLQSRTTSESSLPQFFTRWQSAALPMTLAAVGWWLVAVLPAYTVGSLWSGLLLTKLLVGQALLSPKRGYGEVSLGFGLLLFGAHTLSAQLLSASGLVLAYTLILAGFRVLSHLAQNRSDRVSVAFGSAAHRVSNLIILIAGYAGLYSVYSLAPRLSLVPEIVLSGVIATVWCFAEGRERPATLVLGFFSLLAAECGVVNAVVGADWISLAWAATCLVLLRVPDRHSIVETLASIVLGALAIGSFLFFNLPMTIAGGIATVAFLMQSLVSKNRSLRGFSMVAMNWQLIALVFRLICPDVANIFGLTISDAIDVALPMAALTALSCLVFQHPRILKLDGQDSEVDLNAIVEFQFWALSVVSSLCLTASLLRLNTDLVAGEVMCVLFAFGCLALSMFASACKTKREIRIWGAQGILFSAALYLVIFGQLELGSGVSMFAVLGVAFVNSMLARFAAKRESLAFAVRPLSQLARILPMGTVAIALIRYGKNPAHGWLGLNSLAVLISAAYYFWCGIEEKRKGLVVLAASIVNFALLLLWRDLNFTDPQFFMIPIGVSVVGLVELLKREIPVAMRNPLRYAGALMILVSPTFHIVGGSWLHLISLLVCSTLVALVAIGLRIRPLLYTGTAFLVADVIAMVVRSTIEHSQLLWLYGFGAGVAVIALAAFFENYRANVLARMRLLSAELHTWE